MPSCLFGAPLSDLYRPQAAHGMVSTYTHMHVVYLERITCQARSTGFWAAIQLGGSGERSAAALEPDVPPDKCPSSYDGVSHRHREGETQEGERSRRPSAYAVRHPLPVGLLGAHGSETLHRTSILHHCPCSSAGLSSQPALTECPLLAWRCARCGVRAPRRQAGKSTQVTLQQWCWHFAEKQLDPSDDH